MRKDVAVIAAVGQPAPAPTGRRPGSALALVVILGTLASLATACGATAPRWVAAPPASPAPSESVAPVAPEPAPSSAVPTPSASQPAASSPAGVPAGVTAGIVVFDRQTGAFTEQRNATMQFRSASLVKLLIVLDYLWGRGPDYAIPAADRSRLDLMLRSSDDNAASYFWRLQGSSQVVPRMVARLGLKETAPPSGGRTGWGSTVVSAADIVRIYRYLLDTAPAPVRDYVMGNLRRATRCGTDGFDQSFGIPSAFGQPWAVKQGWYEFGGRPATRCAATAAYPPDAHSAPGVAAPAALVAAPAANYVDWGGEVLHTTGVVGAGDRSIIAVLTVHRSGTPFATASSALTRLTGSLRVPGRA